MLKLWRVQKGGLVFMEVWGYDDSPDEYNRNYEFKYYTLGVDIEGNLHIVEDWDNGSPRINGGNYPGMPVKGTIVEWQD